MFQRLVGLNVVALVGDAVHKEVFVDEGTLHTELCAVVVQIYVEIAKQVPHGIYAMTHGTEEGRLGLLYQFRDALLGTDVYRHGKARKEVTIHAVREPTVCASVMSGEEHHLPAAAHVSQRQCIGGIEDDGKIHAQSFATFVYWAAVDMWPHADAVAEGVVRLVTEVGKHQIVSTELLHVHFLRMLVGFACVGGHFGFVELGCKVTLVEHGTAV